ncbi:transposase, partial [Streptomyces sp. NPDC047987]
VSAMHVHLVFVTKYRRGVFSDEMLTRCEEIMRARQSSLEMHSSPA